MRMAICLLIGSLMSVSLMAQSGPPKLCKPCLFYAGDLDENDANSNGFWNENTLRDPNTQTFAAITVPKGHTLLLEGILFQTLFYQTNKLDPNQVAWEVRTGDIYSNGGTLVASGGGSVVIQPTGRELACCLEYTLAAKVIPAVQLSGGFGDEGTTYWFNLQPQCTNPQDLSCSSGVYFLSNSTQQTNAFRGIAQPGGSAAINSPVRFYQWDDLCGLGFPGCAWMSFGLMGKILR